MMNFIHTRIEDDIGPSDKYIIHNIVTLHLSRSGPVKETFSKGKKIEKAKNSNSKPILLEPLEPANN